MKQEDTKTVKVTIRVPDKISKNIKQQKINQLYEILKPKDKKSA